MEKGINMSVNICNIFRIINLDGDGDIEKYLKFVGVGEPFKNKWLPCVRDRESWMIVSPLRNSTPDSNSRSQDYIYPGIWSSHLSFVL